MSASSDLPEAAQPYSAFKCVSLSWLQLVGAAWRLRKPGGLLSDRTDWHNKTRLVAKLPALDTCPLWQVVRFLNQTGKLLVQVLAGKASHARYTGQCSPIQPVSPQPLPPLQASPSRPPCMRST
jgi:hypothetical protein